MTDTRILPSVGLCTEAVVHEFIERTIESSGPPLTFYTAYICIYCGETGYPA